jgi:hypothetical protein
VPRSRSSSLAPRLQTAPAALDSLLTAIGAAIASDRTLGGAVEWSQPGAPSFTDAEFDGAAAARAATIPVNLWFTTTDTPLA